jgi:hypothetical protein
MYENVIDAVSLFRLDRETSVICRQEFTVRMPEENLQQDLDRKEVEQAFYDLLSYEDEARIAEQMPDALGKSSTIISQYLNPDNERISPVYRSLCLVVAILKFDQQKGRRALMLFMHFAGRYVTGWGTDSAASIRKSLVTKWEAFISGELEQRSTETQVQALEAVVVDAQRLLTSKRKELLRAKAKQNTLKKFAPLRAVGK